MAKLCNMNFSDQLKQYRKQFSFNQAELAQFLEVSPRSVWKWEKGELPHILTQEGAIQRLNQSPPVNSTYFPSYITGEILGDSELHDQYKIKGYQQ